MDVCVFCEWVFVYVSVCVCVCIYTHIVCVCLGGGGILVFTLHCVVAALPWSVPQSLPREAGFRWWIRCTLLWSSTIWNQCSRGQKSICDTGVTKRSRQGHSQPTRGSHNHKDWIYRQNKKYHTIKILHQFPLHRIRNIYGSYTTEVYPYDIHLMLLVSLPVGILYNTGLEWWYVNWVVLLKVAVKEQISLACKWVHKLQCCH